MPPSQSVSLRWKSGALRDSHSPPLSLVKITSVLRVRDPRFSSVARISPTPLIGALEHRDVVLPRVRSARPSAEGTAPLSAAVDGWSGTWNGQCAAL